jgi:hypothetical protein
MKYVEPNFYSFRELTDDADSRSAAKEMQSLQAKDGATFWRFTIDHGGLWVEGWIAEPRYPYQQAPFNPPMEYVK